MVVDLAAEDKTWPDGLACYGLMPNKSVTGQRIAIRQLTVTLALCITVVEGASRVNLDLSIGCFIRINEEKARDVEQAYCTG